MAVPRRNPPRWFVPALFAGMFVAVAVVAAMGALLDQPANRAVAIGERTYVIPAEEVSALILEPHIFLRIRPLDRPFEIVHDGRAAVRRDRAGVPPIFSVNDEGQHDLRYERDERSTVVCRRASSPAGGCGTWISYGGATWSILFPEGRIRDADSFARQATALLKKYDTRVASLLP